MGISHLSLLDDNYPSSFWPESASLSGAKRLFSEFEEDSSSMAEFLSAFLGFDGNLERKPPAGDGFAVSEERQSSLLVGSNQTGRQSDGDFIFGGRRNLTCSAESPPAKRARFDSGDAATTTTNSGESSDVPQRRVWVKKRSKAWWEHVNSPSFPEEEFKREFGMSRATFDMICDELESAVTKKDTMLRSAVPVRQRVAVCIWRLATGEALREVSKRFGLGISTCHKLVQEVSTAIRTVLMPKFLKWPDEQRTAQIAAKFQSISGIPNIRGAIHTTHIPIIAPKANASSYFNKRRTEQNGKPCYTVTVQGVVDPNGIFTDISVGWPGSMSDDQVLEKSSLHNQAANRGDLHDSWIVGGSEHALRDWVLVPYTNQGLSWVQHAYNERIEPVQMIARDSFGRLKARWRCLQKRTEMKLQDLPVVLGACCILHNICVMRNDEVRGSETEFCEVDCGVTAENAARSVAAMAARDQLAHTLFHQSPGSAPSLL